MLEKGWLSEEELTEWQEAAKLEVQQAVTTAQKEAEPNPYQEDWCALAERKFKEAQG